MNHSKEPHKYNEPYMAPCMALNHFNIIFLTYSFTIYWSFPMKGEKYVQLFIAFSILILSIHIFIIAYKSWQDYLSHIIHLSKSLNML